MEPKALAITLTGLLMSTLAAADLPQAEITNGQLHAKLYLPDAKHGFYRGTRFDWSGVVHSLTFQGHDYYGPWFTKTDPTVHDFIYSGADIIAGPCSAVTGPVDEFGPVGYDQAQPGGSFIKIGIGALRRPSAAAYDNYHLYEVANPGQWIVAKHPNAIDFTQELTDPASGYAYLYRKTMRLTPGKPEMVLEQRLENTGKQAIHTTVYNHNFLVLDHHPPGPGVTISLPFDIEAPHPPDTKLAAIRGRDLVYLQTLANQDVVTAPLHGFGAGAADNRIRIEDTRAGAGMTIEANRPLASLSLWSIRSVIAMEPFIAIAIEPGESFTWKTTYTYYQLPPH